MRNKLVKKVFRHFLATSVAASLFSCSLFVSLDGLSNAVVGDSGTPEASIDSAVETSVPFDAGVDSGAPYLVADTCVEDDSDVVDLTSVGITDWAHWGSDADSKNVATHVIGSLVQSSAGNNPYGDDPRTFSWTDGTLVATSSGTHEGIYDDLGPMTITATASTQRQLLTLFISTYSTGASLTVSLIPGAAPVTQALDGIVLGSPHFRCAIHFASPSAAEVAVSFALTDTIDGGGGNLAIVAATVAPDP